MSKKQCKNCVLTTALISTANISLTIGSQQQSRRLTSNNDQNNLNKQQFINQFISFNNLPLRISTSTSNPSSRSLLSGGTQSHRPCSCLTRVFNFNLRNCTRNNSTQQPDNGDSDREFEYPAGLHAAQKQKVVRDSVLPNASAQKSSVGGLDMTRLADASSKLKYRSPLIKKAAEKDAVMDRKRPQARLKFAFKAARGDDKNMGAFPADVAFEGQAKLRYADYISPEAYKNGAIKGRKLDVSDVMLFRETPTGAQQSGTVIGRSGSRTLDRDMIDKMNVAPGSGPAALEYDNPFLADEYAQVNLMGRNIGLLHGAGSTYKGYNADAAEEVDLMEGARRKKLAAMNAFVAEGARAYNAEEVANMRAKRAKMADAIYANNPTGLTGHATTGSGVDRITLGGADVTVD